MNIILYLMNQKGFEVLQSVLDFRGSIDHVVCSRDKAVQNDFYEEIKQFSLRYGIRFYDRKEAPESDGATKIAIGWRWIIKDAGHLIVLHDSIVPKYRGFSPLVNQLIQGEKRIGVTALWASAEYDAGDIIAQEAIDIEYPIKVQDAINRISACYCTLVRDILAALCSGKEIAGRPQEHAFATFSLWRDEKDYWIDFRQSAEYIERFINAVGFPYQGAQARLNDEPVYIDDAVAVSDVVVEDRGRHIGKVIFFRDASPVVVCGDGLLRINKVRRSTGEAVQVTFRSRFS